MGQEWTRIRPMLAVWAMNGSELDQCWQYAPEIDQNWTNAGSMDQKCARIRHLSFPAHYGMLQGILLSPWKSMAVDHCREAIKEAAPSLGSPSLILWAENHYSAVAIIGAAWDKKDMKTSGKSVNVDKNYSILKNGAFVLGFIKWYTCIYEEYLMYCFSWSTDTKKIYSCKNNKKTYGWYILISITVFMFHFWI